MSSVFAVSRYLDTWWAVSFQLLICTHFHYKQPACVSVEIVLHPTGDACASMTVECASPMPGAFHLLVPRMCTRSLPSPYSTLTAFHTQQSSQGTASRGLETDSHFGSTSDLFLLHSHPWAFIAFYVHRVLYSWQGPHHTHPFITGSNHGFNCFVEKDH